MPRDLEPNGPVADRVSALNARYRHHSATAVLEHALNDDDLGRVALVSPPSGRNRWCCCIWCR
jgi:phosphoadenosine phosphosulfate reductase